MSNKIKVASSEIPPQPAWPFLLDALYLKVIVSIFVMFLRH